MKENTLKYKFVGYINIDCEYDDLQFAISLFTLNNELYRYEATNNGIITRFFRIKCDYIPIKDGGLYEFGENAVYVFSYKGEVFTGTMEKLRPEFQKLLKLSDEELEPLRKYEIGFILNDPEVVNKSINDYVNSPKNKLGLKAENFLKL